jgi:Glutathione S-transferase, N-terminal domain
MTITITAFERSPDGGKGLARDTRVRWALEEVGQPYEVRLVSFLAMKQPAHRALHPFGQIPTYEEDDLALFETGAIVFHVAEHHTGLRPDKANAGRARSHACSPRSTRWNRRSWNSETPGCWKATRPGMTTACLWSRIAFATGRTNFSVAWAMLIGSMVRSERATG